MPTSSPPLRFDISRLLAPATFDHAVSDLRLIETHLSWLVLTGEYTYKIKKALRTPFIDAATLELRNHLCGEELRLNRRLAPSLYLDVLPVVAMADGLRMGGPGEPIEYAVKMQQFKAGDELLELLRVNAVTVADTDRLADLLATFHEQAAVATAGTAADHMERTSDILLSNVTELAANLRKLRSTASIEQIGNWLRDSLVRCESMLQQRWQSGHIRDCHGDLHAGNVVRFDGRLQPFDCLEFSERLRTIDVLDDLAFLVMDLAGHDRDDLATALLSRYLERTGDYTGLPLLPIYATHRALVRAKVDAMSALTLPKRRLEFETRLQRRLLDAERWSAPKHPDLVLMHGVSGSGKTWVSDRLVPKLRAVRLRSDIERKRLAGLSPTQRAGADFQSGIYSIEFSKRMYSHLRECAEYALRSGFTTIVDASFLEVTDREVFYDLARQLNAPVTIVSCYADGRTLEERVLVRSQTGEDASDATLDVMMRQLQHLQPLAASEPARVVNVDSRDCSIDAVVASIRSRST